MKLCVMHLRFSSMFEARASQFVRSRRRRSNAMIERDVGIDISLRRHYLTHQDLSTEYHDPEKVKAHHMSQ